MKKRQRKGSSVRLQGQTLRRPLEAPCPEARYNGRASGKPLYEANISRIWLPLTRPGQCLVGEGVEVGGSRQRQVRIMGSAHGRERGARHRVQGRE